MGCGGPGSAMTAREIADALVADKAPQATRKQFKDLQAAVLAALRKRDGAMVVSNGGACPLVVERSHQLRLSERFQDDAKDQRAYVRCLQRNGLPCGGAASRAGPQNLSR